MKWYKQCIPIGYCQIKSVFLPLIWTYLSFLFILLCNISIHFLWLIQFISLYFFYLYPPQFISLLVISSSLEFHPVCVLIFDHILFNLISISMFYLFYLLMIFLWWDESWIQVRFLLLLKVDPRITRWPRSSSNPWLTLLNKSKCSILFRLLMISLCRWNVIMNNSTC